MQCSFCRRILQSLAEVHAELVLIHPFQYGTERVTMMLTTLMALQAGMPILNFQDILTSKSEEYADALKAALDEDYAPMKELFEEVIALSVRSLRRGVGTTGKSLVNQWVSSGWILSFPLRYTIRHDIFGDVKGVYERHECNS